MKRKVRLTKKADTTLKVIFFIQMLLTASLNDFEFKLSVILFIIVWMALMVINAIILVKFGRN